MSRIIISGFVHVNVSVVSNMVVHHTVFFQHISVYFSLTVHWCSVGLVCICGRLLAACGGGAAVVVGRYSMPLDAVDDMVYNILVFADNDYIVVSFIIAHKHCITFTAEAAACHSRIFYSDISAV